MAEDDEYSPAQKQKIARHFLLVAPHGEVKDVARDLKQVVTGGILDDQWLQTSMTEYNKRRFEICESDTCKVICCPQGEVAANEYLEPAKKLICTIDPVGQKIVSTRDAGSVAGSGDNEQYRIEIQNELKEYLANFYEDGSTPQSVATGMGSVYVSPEGQIALVISYKNINIGNFWTGGWQSEWTFSVQSKTKAKLEGRIRLNVHYYEDGNVQLNSKFTENSDIEVSDPKATAKKALKAIENLENEFQKKLDKFYVKMGDSTFQQMRRKLPKIGKPMDWRASIHALITEQGASK